MPKFKVWRPDYGHEVPDDGTRVVAEDAQNAAQEWAFHEDGDSNEYHIVGGQDADVRVTDESGMTKRFNVRGVHNRDYYAQEIRSDNASEVRE